MRRDIDLRDTPWINIGRSGPRQSRARKSTATYSLHCFQGLNAARGNPHLLHANSKKAHRSGWALDMTIYRPIQRSSQGGRLFWLRLLLLRWQMACRVDGFQPGEFHGLLLDQFDEAAEQPSPF